MYTYDKLFGEYNHTVAQLLLTGEDVRFPHRRQNFVNAMERLRDYKGDILLFARDWQVPFTNNEAERTIRFSKVKQKVSGCFRTKEGADDYMKIMSFLSTARKQGVTWFHAVQEAMNGNALTLAAQWT